VVFEKMNLYSWIIFLIGSVGIIIVSRKSLLQPRLHGLYRFFAWEILLVMLLYNLDGWFHDPLSWRQLISWILLLISLALVILGVRLLRVNGRPDSSRSDPVLLGMEKTSRLVTVGLYRYIRHPLYSSLLFLAWGIFFKSPSWLDAGLALLCTLLLTITARVEEGENIRYFGGEYREYMKHSKMFVPYLF
jgi:protein-S-isoprenylcysteine O-methyltransferase Ste14